MCGKLFDAFVGLVDHYIKPLASHVQLHADEDLITSKVLSNAIPDLPHAHFSP